MRRELVHHLADSSTSGARSKCWRCGEVAVRYVEIADANEVMCVASATFAACGVSCDLGREGSFRRRRPRGPPPSSFGLAHLLRDLTDRLIQNVDDLVDVRGRRDEGRPKADELRRRPHQQTALTGGALDALPKGSPSGNGSLVSRSRTNSRPLSSPMPRTSPMTSCFSARRRKRVAHPLPHLPSVRHQPASHQLAHRRDARRRGERFPA